MVELHDLAIRGALIEDGSGHPAYEGDIAIDGSFIAALGEVGSAHAEINAQGLVAAPGFIDAHTHDDMELHRNPNNQSKLRQGVTTVVCGCCGFSAFPHSPPQRSPDLLGVEGNWHSYREYRETLLGHGIGTNLVAFVGHNTVQRLLCGLGSAEPSAVALVSICDEIRRAMDEGAFGVSTGLIYRPGREVSAAALSQIVATVADYGGIHNTHIRNEADAVLDALAEAISIAEDTGVGLQISHLKVIGEHNWGGLGDALSVIDAARVQGIDIGFDVYPYCAGSGPLSTYFPPENIDETRALLVQIIRCLDYPQFEGRRLGEIAEEQGTSVDSIVRQLVTAPQANETLCVIFEIHEDDMLKALLHPLAMIGSDGIPQEHGVPHPRLLGTFPRTLGYYCRERSALSQSAAIAKMTSVPAARFRLHNRGLLQVGFVADVALFDPATIADQGTYTSRAFPTGIHHVFVNGQHAISESVVTGLRAGQVLSASP